MKRLTVVLLILLSLLVLAEVCQGRGRGGGGRGGGGRAGGSRGGSRSSRSSRSGSKSRPKITKFTRITPKSRTTAVIKKQAPTGYRSSTARNVLVGYVVSRYSYRTAKVFSEEYQLYGRRSVTIPDGRAVRIMSTQTRMLDLDDNLCLSNVSAQRLERELPEHAHVLRENATIQYENDKPQPFDGIDRNFTMRAQEGADFTIVTRTQYNATLVEGENCFVVEERVAGTVVRMYATNPNDASAALASGLLSFLALLAALVWPRLDNAWQDWSRFSCTLVFFVVFFLFFVLVFFRVKDAIAMLFGRWSNFRK